MTPAITLAAILGERDPFMSPREAVSVGRRGVSNVSAMLIIYLHDVQKNDADRVKDSWASDSPGYRSDTFAILNAFEKWIVLEERGDYRAATEFCHQNFL